MLDALLAGLLATSSLIVGGLIASWFNLGRRTLGVIMAFGAGALISAVAYELVFESVKLAKGSGYPGLGFACGAAVFFICDRMLQKSGISEPTDLGASHQSNLVVPMVLAIILDGVPESIVLGLGMLEGGAVSLAMLAAIFISNLPEAMAGTTGMRLGGWTRTKIFMVWLSIAVICALVTAASYTLFNIESKFALAFIQAFAGGAILMMLANSMMPEAYEHGGKLAGVFTVTGFAVSVTIILLESG